jgi:uncharacterized membrane protein
METILIAFNIIFLMSCISISYLFKKNYPTDINSIIGYRTKRSMVSKESWVFANKYSSNLLFKYSIITVIIQIALFTIFGGKIAILSAASLWIILLLTTLWQTEVNLKKTQSLQI